MSFVMIRSWRVGRMAPVHPRLGLRAASIAALTALGLAGCGGNGTPPSLVGRVLTVPGRAGTIAARARVAAGPTAVAVGEGGVWVADNSAGILTRLDPGTGRVTGPGIPVGPGPLAVAAGEGAVWVATGDGRVRRVDPRTRRVAPGGARIPGVSGLAVGAGAVWATSGAGGTVQRIDPASGRLRGAPIRTGAGAADVAVGGGAVWVADAVAGDVARIDPGSGRVVARTRVAPAQPRGQVLALTYGAGGVWVAKTSARLAQPIDLLRLDPASGRVTGPALRVTGRVGLQLAAGPGAVWITDAGNALPSAPRRAPSVLRVDVRRRALVGRGVRTGPDPQGIAVGAGAVWVTDADANRVTRLVP